MKKNWCNRANSPIIPDELTAKMVLAERVWKDKGEKRYYKCLGHFHLAAMSEEEYEQQRKGRSPQSLTSSSAA